MECYFTICNYTLNDLIVLYLTYFFYQYKSNKTIRMFYGKFGDEEDNLVDNSNIFNLEGDNRLLTGLI